MGLSFLDFPAELRVNVYQKVAEDETAWVFPAEREHVFSIHGLAATNRQIRDEYLATLRISCRDFAAVVRNFCYDHVSLFYNNLLSAQARGDPPTIQPKPDNFSVYLKIDVEPHFTTPLENWFEQFEAPRFASATSKFCYSFHESQRWDGPWLDLIEDWQECAHAMAITTGEGRKQSHMNYLVRLLRLAYNRVLG